MLTAISLTLPSPLGANGERTIALYNVHTKETLRIAYKRNGRFVPDAMAKLNWHLRDWRSNARTEIDPALIDLVWEIHTELGSRMPVHVISGYRSPATNAMLRKTRGGQAKRSQHMLGRAMDVMFPDIPVRRLRYSALLREQGGVGYYPTSATPFIHVDTGRVRHWPRMSRQELALLFPSGRTQHRPSSGGPISRSDAMIARQDNPALAQRVAAFHDHRRHGPAGAGSGVQVAAANIESLRPASVPSPQLVARPRLASRVPEAFRPKPVVGAGQWIATPRPEPQRPRMASLAPSLPRLRSDPIPLPFRPTLPAISSHDRNQLTHLASAAFASGAVAQPKSHEWISAPAFDEEHPEELFYRPFPIAPYITLTASADDRALQQLTHPDIDKTLELLVADSTDDPPLQLRPGLQTASLMWSQSFGGGAAGQPSEPQPEETASTWLGRQLVQLAGR